VTAPEPRSSPNQAQQALPTLSRVAQDLGAAAYAVGGYVRDRILQRTTSDIDVLVTRALREVTERTGLEVKASVVTLHETQPTMRLAFPDRSHIDLALPRVAAVDAGGLATPEAIVEADLQARDFTVNAMAIPLEAADLADWREHVLDPMGGLPDLDRRLIRAIDPRVWDNDPIRLWRALRLAAQLGFELEPPTEDGIRQHAGLAAKPAGERIRDELFRLLARADADALISRAAELGLLFVLAPELAPLQTLAQGGYHHLDGWRHSLAVVRAIHELTEELPGMPAAYRGKLGHAFAKPIAGDRPRLSMLKFAGLLHDVGKPATRTVDEQGSVHFYGHEKVSAVMAREVGHRLRLGRRELHYLEMATRLHMHPALLAQQQEISRRAAHRFFRKAGAYAPDVLILAWADRLSARGPAATAQHIEQVEYAIRWLLAEWLDSGPLSHPQPPVGARAIMRRYDVPPGPEVGRVLRALTRRHAEQPFMDAESAWAFLDRVVQRSGRSKPESNDDDAHR
jgi:poly(A) polymerase